MKKKSKQLHFYLQFEIKVLSFWLQIELNKGFIQQITVVRYKKNFKFKSRLIIIT